MAGNTTISSLKNKNRISSIGYTWLTQKGIIRGVQQRRFWTKTLSSIDKDKDTDGLISSLRQQFGRLELETNDLEGRNQRSGILKTMFLVFREDGAKDWNSNLLISLSHQGKQHRLQFHHIFPKAVLKGHHRPIEINDIANLAFVGGKTNRKISAKQPKENIPEIMEKQGTTPFDKQCIPTDGRLLSVDKYSEFLAERRKQIVDRLSAILERVRLEGQEAGPAR